MFDESLDEAITQLQLVQSQLKDSRLEEVLLLLSMAKKSAKKEFFPMTDEQARDMFRKLPKGWRPLEFVRQVEKFHSIQGKSR